MTSIERIIELIGPEPETSRILAEMARCGEPLESLPPAEFASRASRAARAVTSSREIPAGPLPGRTAAVLDVLDRITSGRRFDDDLADEVERFRRISPARARSLVTTLETAEIEPRSALLALAEDDAGSVCRLALITLRHVLRRSEDLQR